MTDHLPVAANRGDVALAGNAADGGIGAALQTLMASLNDRAQAFDDISVHLHSETSADGATRSAFSYRAYKHKR